MLALKTFCAKIRHRHRVRQPTAMPVDTLVSASILRRWALVVAYAPISMGTFILRLDFRFLLGLPFRLDMPMTWSSTLQG
jgi:hypothetical protein